MNNKFEWTDEFISGNEQIDQAHEQIFIQINELYELFSDTKNYYNQIVEKVGNLKILLVKHCEAENELFEKYDISEKEEHIQANNEIIQTIIDLENNLSPMIFALTLIDTIISYFLYHFPKYDKKSLLELNKKISAES